MNWLKNMVEANESNTLFKRIRYNIIASLLSDGEKYMLKRACDDRIDTLHKHRVMNPFGAAIGADESLGEYYYMNANIFANKLWA